mmetsp:Transcript_1087/g.2266  ORF Transcript_1087/g.2266 Transcript_1087/m.2266 type:complete len:172 (+) Transcript_1087:246-761(+)
MLHQAFFRAVERRAGASVSQGFSTFARPTRQFQRIESGFDTSSQMQRLALRGRPSASEERVRRAFDKAVGAYPVLLASPLFFKEWNEPTTYSEFFYVFGNLYQGFIDSIGHTELGDHIMVALIAFILLGTYMRVSGLETVAAMYYKHTFGASWKVGHHLRGHAFKNPLKKV